MHDDDDDVIVTSRLVVKSVCHVSKIYIYICIYIGERGEGGDRGREGERKGRSGEEDEKDTEGDAGVGAAGEVVVGSCSRVSCFIQRVERGEEKNGREKRKRKKRIRAVVYCGTSRSILGE